MPAKGPSVEEVLRRTGPLHSSALLDELERHAPSREAARQRLRRAGKPVLRLRPSLLPKGSNFYYLGPQFDNAEYWSRLRAALTETGAVGGDALGSLEGRGGRVPPWLWGTISGAPTERMTRQVSAASLFTRLNKADLVRFDADDIILPPHLAGSVEDTAACRAQLKAEQLVLELLRDWLERNGLASSIDVRNSTAQPMVGAFEWDLCGPSYAFPLRSPPRRNETKARHGFLVADINLRPALSGIQVRAFLRKCVTYRSAGKSRPLFPILLADGYDALSVQTARAAGLILTTPAALLGNELANAVATLRRILAQLATSP